MKWAMAIRIETSTGGGKGGEGHKNDTPQDFSPAAGQKGELVKKKKHSFCACKLEQTGAPI